MNKYDFVCPECGDKNLEQRMTNVTVDTAIKVNDKGRVVWGLQHNSGDVEIVGFMCGNSHILELPSGPVVDEDDLITWFNYEKYAKELVARQPGDMVSHVELVHHISVAYERLEGEELVTLFNDLFPNNKIIYEGDSIYRWVKT